MKIAILSDIHGNADALRAVFSSRDFKEVEHLFILGDIVGYYYEPHLILDQLSAFSSDRIKGNHEVFLSATDAQLIDIRKKYGSGIDHALTILSKQQITELSELPAQKLVKIDAITALLCHGSPWSIDEYIYPDAPQETLNSCATYAQELGANFLFMGHTHHPFLYTHAGCTVANPGSVGQARDRGGLACWQLLDSHSKVLIQKRTPYNIAALKQRAKENDPAVDYLTRILERE